MKKYDLYQPDFDEFDTPARSPKFRVIGYGYEDEYVTAESYVDKEFKTEAAASEFIDELCQEDPEDVKYDYNIPDEVTELELREFREATDEFDEDEILSIRTIYFN